MREFCGVQEDNCVSLEDEDDGERMLLDGGNKSSSGSATAVGGELARR